MKKKYIKPEIIIIKTYNDDALLVAASLYEINKSHSVNIANEDDDPISDYDKEDDDYIIWND